jgi:hypothetical protein
MKLFAVGYRYFKAFSDLLLKNEFFATWYKNEIGEIDLQFTTGLHQAPPVHPGALFHVLSFSPCLFFSIVYTTVIVISDLSSLSSRRKTSKSLKNCPPAFSADT